MQIDMKEKKEVGGLYFSEDTPDKVIELLLGAYISKKRIRLFYGDKDTGSDWMEIYDTIGRIGKTTGKRPVPILIKTKRSIGGHSISTDNIVKITINKKVVYEHPKYNLPVKGKYVSGRYLLTNTLLGSDVFVRTTKDGYDRILDFLNGVSNSIR